MKTKGMVNLGPWAVGNGAFGSMLVTKDRIKIKHVLGILSYELCRGDVVEVTFRSKFVFCTVVIRHTIDEYPEFLAFDSLDKTVPRNLCQLGWPCKL